MKVIVVYQPHQNIRQHEPSIQAGYRNCFAKADLVYWLPTYLSREGSLPILSPQEILSRSHLLEDAKFKIANRDQVLVQKLTEHQQNGDLIIFMGAGSIDSWARTNLPEITQK